MEEAVKRAMQASMAESVASLNIYEKLAHIQNELKSPKDQKAKQYRFRNIEDINEAVKPLALKYGCAVTYSDERSTAPDMGMVFCDSVCTLDDGKGSVSACSFSAVNVKPQFMSIEQACGAASSYARKYAAQGLFAIDSSELDPDRTQGEKPKADAVTSAKHKLWATVKEYCSASGLDPKELYGDVMHGLGDSPTPELLDEARNALLTELRANA